MTATGISDYDLLHVPWSDSSFSYAITLIIALLAITAGLLVVVTARGRGGASPRELWSRWLTWAILAPLFAIIVFSGALAVAALMGLFALQATREWSALTDLPKGHRTILAASSVLAVSLALFGTTALLATIPLLLLTAMLLPVLRANTTRGMRDLAFGALGFAYLPLLLSFGVLMVRDISSGAALLFATGVAVAASDIGAYITGKTFGSRPLSPTLSPNKTVEGLAGNVAGALLAFLVLWPILPGATLPGLIVLTAIVAIGSVWGDLFTSALKREVGVKDAGTLLPGFGGLLDRIDSFIVAVPLVYYAVSLGGLIGIGVAA